ncbi:uncharacterized protein LOC119669474 [Teleopsis dalmanni]|uniref:uncharacterized protein LOC119669474 n=1 Tax=Teleopsis dalmanni TaxID=139649 RepID=UPI0018CDB177|nr:uncharacterized protein LOC119669474 [Teleopsis dalmanni]
MENYFRNSCFAKLTENAKSYHWQDVFMCLGIEPNSTIELFNVDFKKLSGVLCVNDNPLLIKANVMYTYLQSFIGSIHLIDDILFFAIILMSFLTICRASINYRYEIFRFLQICAIRTFNLFCVPFRKLGFMRKFFKSKSKKKYNTLDDTKSKLLGKRQEQDRQNTKQS